MKLVKAYRCRLEVIGDVEAADEKEAREAFAEQIGDHWNWNPREVEVEHLGNVYVSENMNEEVATDKANEAAGYIYD